MYRHLTAFAFATLLAISPALAENARTKAHPGQKVLMRYVALVKAGELAEAKELESPDPRIRADRWVRHVEGLRDLTNRTPFKIRECWLMDNQVIGVTAPINIQTTGKNIFLITVRESEGQWAVWAFAIHKPESWERTMARIKEQEGKRIYEAGADSAIREP